MEYYGDENVTPSFSTRLKHAWNVFRNKDPVRDTFPDVTVNEGVGMTYRPDRRRPVYYGTDKTIAGAIYTRISTDVSSAVIHHCRMDAVGGFLEEMDSGLNECLTVSANIDQTGKAFVQELTMSVLEDGVAAAVPVDTNVNPLDTGSFDIQSMRVGKILQWWPRKVQMEVYNDHKGLRETITLPKEKVAIIENPFYAIMNEPNSVLKRLIKKMALLDSLDDAAASGRLDLIIQLPYVTKSETRQKQAESRRKQIEDQLVNSTYGIAYIDGTEHVTQLNRPVDNQLVEQIELLTKTLYSQLGMTQDILNGTATEDVMTNYYKRTVDVILTAIVDEFTRKFLTKTARTQRQAIKFYRDPFSLTPTNAIADIADKFTRNEILTPNEVRGIVGFKPSSDPKADELRNRNINQSVEELGYSEEGYGQEEPASAIEVGRQIMSRDYKEEV